MNSGLATVSSSGVSLGGTNAFRLGGMERYQPVAEVEARALRLATMEITHGRLRHTALAGNLLLRQAGLGKVDDDLLPVHERGLKHRDADIVPNGLPNVNIGKLMAVREPTRTAFGQRIYDERMRLGLKQLAVAQKLGIRQGTLSELEKKGHGTSHVATLAAIYNVDPVWLATGKGERAGLAPRDEGADIPSPGERAHLRQYRWLSDDDRRDIDAQTGELAMRELGRQAMSKMGLNADATPGAATPIEGSKERQGDRKISGGISAMRSRIAAPAAAKRRTNR